MAAVNLPLGVSMVAHRPVDRPRLVLLAGLLCDSEIWNDVAALLAADFDVRILSFPMFSSIEAMAEKVATVMDGRFSVAGHSMGGRVALEMMRLFPERVTGLALLNTGIHPPTPLEPESRGRLIALAREQGMRAVAMQWLPPMMASDSKSRADLIDRLTAMVERQTIDSFAAQIHALLTRPNPRAVLADIRVPVVLVSGTEDAWSPPKQHEEMHRLCAVSELTVIECAGHMSPIEKPAEVTAVLRSWLARVSACEHSKRQLTHAERLSISNACAQQLYRLARLNDAGAFEAVSRLFIEDATFIRPSDPANPLRGRAAILASLTSRPARETRHVLSGVEVIVESEVRATVISTVVMYTGEPMTSHVSIAATAVGSYTDVFCNVDGEWLIKERRGRIDMKGTASVG